MKEDVSDQEKIRQYLLGLMSSEQALELEQRLLTDDAFYEELLIVEEEIIDQHVSGQLSPAEETNVESHFLNAHQRQVKLRFARSLKKYITSADAHVNQPSARTTLLQFEDTRQRKRPSFWFASPLISYAAAVAALVLVSAASWLVLQRLRQPSPGNMITEVIKPGGLTRDGGEVKQIIVPRGTTSVRLLLELPADGYDQYQAVILGEEGNAIFATGPTKEETIDGRNVLILQLGSRSLPPGDYQIRLSGVSTNGRIDRLESYRFRVKTSG